MRKIEAARQKEVQYRKI